MGDAHFTLCNDGLVRRFPGRGFFGLPLSFAGGPGGADQTNLNFQVID